MIRTTSLALATILLSGAAAYSQQPGHGNAGRDYVVQNYELSTDAGRRAVLRRLEREIAAACDSTRRMSLPRVRAADNCHEAELDRVVSALGDPRLLALHRNDRAVQLASADRH
ncbi:MAG: UrcA family protein [Pseudomonadota bacterium]|nr:UrcA family protein [Pseudomonadota bacterium]